MTATRVLTPSNPGTREKEFHKWLEEHDIDPTLCHRIEVKDEADSMVVYCYAVNEEGNKYIVEASPGIERHLAQAPPQIVPMKRPMPDLGVVGSME